MKRSKERIDILIVKKGLIESREKAKRNIMAGLVFVNNERVDKPGTKVYEDSDIYIKGKAIPYVSRGGLKLEKALKEFDVHVQDKIALDIGASTGGFTDCMLQNEAKKVYAIDVGYGQLDWKIRNDPRVVVMEKTNVRYTNEEDIEDKANFVSIDVSFISLKLILPVAKKLTTDDVDIVALIKPQFEAGREKVGKKGVVRDKSVHIEVIENIMEFCSNNDLNIVQLTFSPIKGAEGNIEYLAHIKKGKMDTDNMKEYIRLIVDKSHDF